MYNKCNLIGHLGKDPEIKTVGDIVVGKFSLATGKKYKNKSGETVEETQWHNIVVWGKGAEIAEKYLKKGSFVLVEGEIRYRTWEGEDKIKKYFTEIYCLEFKMLDKKPGNKKPIDVSGEIDEPPF